MMIYVVVMALLSVSGEAATIAFGRGQGRLRVDHRWEQQVLRQIGKGSYRDGFTEAKPAVWSWSAMVAGVNEVLALVAGQGSPWAVHTAKERSYVNELISKAYAEIVFVLNTTAAKLDAAPQDVVRNNAVLDAWGTGAYSCDLYTHHIVHFGVIGSEIAQFFLYIFASQDKALIDVYGTVGLSALKRLHATITTDFADMWDDGGGFYRKPSSLAALASCARVDQTRAGQPLPYNQSLLPTRLRMLLWKAQTIVGTALFSDAEAAAHKQAAEKGLRWFRDALQQVEIDLPDGGAGSLGDGPGYEWLYLVGGRWEDVGHGVVDVRVVELAYDLGLGQSVFGQAAAVFAKFARTWYRVMDVPQFHLEQSRTHVVTTYGHVNEDYLKSAGGWLPALRGDPVMYDVVRDLFERHQFTVARVAGMLVRWRADDYLYPTIVGNLDGTELPSGLQPVVNAHAALGPNNEAALLERNSTTALVALSANDVKASSCAMYSFTDFVQGTLELSIAYSSKSSSADGSAGETPSGFLLFVSGAETTPSAQEWIQISGTHSQMLKEQSVDAFLVTAVDIPAPREYKRVLVCRAGFGHGGSNLLLRWIRLNVMQTEPTMASTSVVTQTSTSTLVPPTTMSRSQSRSGPSATDVENMGVSPTDEDRSPVSLVANNSGIRLPVWQGLTLAAWWMVVWM